MSAESRASTAGWQFEKRINLGDILSSVALVGTLAVFMITLDKRVTVLEEKQTQQVAIDRQQDERVKDLNNEVKGELKDISAKLDKLVERQLDARGGK
ncbi:hypothetical protein [Pseudogulbenkiania ferrooxidans]|uniref:Uncharacterized protein n=1 Tax=Pseudogulbenkiania ferrooxidans 2002 TaxID=279714 RepID=B9Z501_9NEIS|nr:hypothetical protein [Pseudogulbenkiania ferrooxidans]EEG08233.1 conserved hypothetical protein [Pseudogulbenkiania ferrooxidans 2002]